VPTARPWAITRRFHGVEHALEHPEATPADSHENWLAEKRQAGWKYGPVKDAEKREHPCFVPYEALSTHQRAKDALFLAIVRALSP
jgi:hypothetical protein